MARPRKETQAPETSDNFVYSTLANGQTYVTYMHQEGVPPVAVHKVHIRGGAGLAVDIGNGAVGETPVGVVTPITDEDVEHLEKNFCFQEHKKRGFVIIVKKRIDTEVAAADMNRQDPSAPQTPADFEKQGFTVSGKKDEVITMPVIENEQ